MTNISSLWKNKDAGSQCCELGLPVCTKSLARAPHRAGLQQTSLGLGCGSRRRYSRYDFHIGGWYSSASGMKRRKSDRQPQCQTVSMRLLWRSNKQSVGSACIWCQGPCTCFWDSPGSRDTACMAALACPTPLSSGRLAWQHPPLTHLHRAPQIKKDF